ncbi:MAG: preprotein translocase subunit SecY [Flavobacteriales bacterium]
MRALIDKIKQIWSIEELKNRIILTFSLILVYRIGSFIVLPGIDPDGISSKGEIFDLINIFAGGAFNRASIMALGIMPYISASIIMQLAGIAVPAIQKMQSEGESGRKKITQYTRILTIIICALQAPGYLSAYVPTSAILGGAGPNPLWYITSVTLLIAGCMFAMWLGEKITDKGIGNGISILIMIGIIAGLPGAFAEETVSRMGDGGFVILLLEIVFLVVVTIFSILLVQGTRRIPIQSTKRVVGARGNSDRVAGGARSFIPLKVNAAGVMPIIFAQALMFIPAMFSPDSTTFSNINGFWYNFVFALMVIIFTYFYTAITVNPKKIAEDLNRSGSFIPGVKPGEKTANFIDTLLSRITLPGSIMLALIAILPVFAVQAGIKQSLALFYGGTSLLILVGVMLDTLQQVESHLLSRHYDGLMKNSRLKGKGGGTAFQSAGNNTSSI